MSNAPHPIANSQTSQVGTIAKRISSNVYHTVWDHHALKLGTVIKCIFSDACHSVRNYGFGYILRPHTRDNTVLDFKQRPYPVRI